MNPEGRRFLETRLGRMLRLLGLATGTVALGLAGLYGIHLGATHGRVLREFEDLAANQYYHVLTEPVRLRPGMDARAAGLAGRLSRAGLRRVHRENTPVPCCGEPGFVCYAGLLVPRVLGVGEHPLRLWMSR